MLGSLWAELGDRAAARGTVTTALGAAGWTSGAVALTPALVSGIVLLGFFLFTIWLVHSPPQAPSEAVATLLNVVIGALVAGFTAVVNFWLGSSQGSRDKDRMMAVLQAAQWPAATPAAPRPPMPHPVAAPAPSLPTPVPAYGPPDRFDLCVEVVLAKEGGFANHPADPGGPTMLGITQRTLAAWRGRPVTAAEVAALTREEAKEIYRAQYWNAMRCVALPAGLDLMVFDYGVNAGPATAVGQLQRALGTRADGVVGPITLRAVQAARAPTLIEALAKVRLDQCQGNPTFGRGWAARIADIRRQALLMAAG